MTDQPVNADGRYQDARCAAAKLCSPVSALMEIEPRNSLHLTGANNVAQLGPLFGLLAQNGTELIIEAHDMDKYSNEMIAKGSSKI